jgi:hypothetical protein
MLECDVIANSWLSIVRENQTPHANCRAMGDITAQGRFDALRRHIAANNLNSQGDLKLAIFSTEFSR